MTETVNWDQSRTIFNIQRFSLHDGSGIRTIVTVRKVIELNAVLEETVNLNN